jgi:tetratricopeptide (TPR) repeat protein
VAYRHSSWMAMGCSRARCRPRRWRMRSVRGTRCCASVRRGSQSRESLSHCRAFRPAMSVSWTWILAIALMTSTSGCAFPVSHDQTHRETISLSCRPDERLHRGDALASDCTKVIQSPDATVEEQALAYFYRGTVRLEAGQPGVALMDLDQAIRLNPNTQRVFLARCEAYLAIGQPDLAIRDCDRSSMNVPRLQ